MMRGDSNDLSEAPPIVVIDYGLGNVGAVLNMFEHLGIDAVASKDLDCIRNATKILLPGVGSFDRAMTLLGEQYLIEPLTESVIRRKTPCLGICLGMQLITKSSEEGNLPGLGWVDAKVVRIRLPIGSELKIPHMGWSSINICRENPILKSEESQRFYFDHSYHVECKSSANCIADFSFGNTLCCALQSNNIFGVQFHPEKSHRFGMSVLRNFAMLSGCAGDLVVD